MGKIKSLYQIQFEFPSFLLVKKSVIAIEFLI